MSGRFLAVLTAALAISLPSTVHAQLYTETSALHGDPTRSSEAFGITVATDGNTIVAGTSRSSSPTGPRTYPAYVYARGSTGWTLQQRLDLPTYDVAVDGDTLVGGGVVYVRSGSTWTVQQTLIALDHPRPALQGDTLVLGNPFDPTQERGGVYVFTRSGSTWTQQAAFGPDGPATSENMGDTVALDGDTFIAGVNSGSGGAYVFVRSGTTWTRQARLVLPTGHGWGMGVALKGDTAAVSDPADEEVYIFTRAGTTWTLTQTLTMPYAGGNDYGYKLSLSGDVLAVGADETFYLYARTSAGWTFAQKLTPGSRLPGGAALGDQGRLFVEGNPSDNSSTGVVNIFSVPPPPAPGSGWRDTDVGTVGAAGGSSITGAAGSVSGSGADIWDAADQFHFRSETLTGDGAIIARVTSAGTTHPWAKAGLMFRESVAPVSRSVMALVTPGAHLGLQARGVTADATSFVDAGGAAAPIWLMLARTGNHFDGFRSDDGTTWTTIGSTTVVMPPTIYIGLAVSSHDNTALNTGTFSGIELVGTGTPPSPPPPPPSAALAGNDVGAVAVAGSFTDADGTLTIDAAGADLWNQADSGYFVHREITGDFDIRAHVTSLTNTNPWAKAGLMVRESLAAGSRNIFTLLTAGAASGMQVRDTTDGATSFTSGPWVNAPYWVRLVRTGNNFQAMISPDGATWQTVGTQTLALSATLQAGVAVSSHVANTRTHVTVTGIALGGTPPPPPPPSDTLAGSDVGSVAVAGAFTGSSGNLTIDAAGADLWNQADSGYFVHREITGDFDIRAHVTSLTNTNPWAKVGVMVRESLAAGSRNIFTLLTAGAASGMQVRDTTNGATSFTSGPWFNAPYWVRLVRTGNSFQAMISADGTTWQSVGTQALALPATLQAGVAVSSHVANTTTHATVTALQFGN